VVGVIIPNLLVHHFPDSAVIPNNKPYYAFEVFHASQVHVYNIYACQYMNMYIHAMQQQRNKTSLPKVI